MQPNFDYKISYLYPINHGFSKRYSAIIYQEVSIDFKFMS